MYLSNLHASVCDHDGAILGVDVEQHRRVVTSVCDGVLDRHHVQGALPPAVLLERGRRENRRGECQVKAMGEGVTTTHTHTQWDYGLFCIFPDGEVVIHTSISPTTSYYLPYSLSTTNYMAI